jgi:putative heme-binding domain-containing protein
VLFSRPKAARMFLDQIEAKKLPAADVPVEQLRRMAVHRDKELDALIRKHWGNIQPGTPEEKLATMRRLSNDLRAGAGDPLAGKALFQNQCGQCHKLFGEGASVGPDLTTFSRRDTEALLANIVDPSAVIKSQYISYVVTLRNGVVYTGLIAEQDAGSITLLDAKNTRMKISRGQIEELHDSPVSLMPEDQWKAWSPQQLRDLFAYLQRERPLPK